MSIADLITDWRRRGAAMRPATPPDHARLAEAAAQLGPRPPGGDLRDWLDRGAAPLARFSLLAARTTEPVPDVLRIDDEARRLTLTVSQVEDGARIRLQALGPTLVELAGATIVLRADGTDLARIALDADGGGDTVLAGTDVLFEALGRGALTVVRAP